MYLFDALPLQKLNLLIVADRGITHVEEQLLTTNPLGWYECSGAGVIKFLKRAW